MYTHPIRSPTLHYSSTLHKIDYDANLYNLYEKLVHTKRLITNNNSFLIFSEAFSFSSVICESAVVVVVWQEVVKSACENGSSDTKGDRYL